MASRAHIHIGLDVVAAASVAVAAILTAGRRRIGQRKERTQAARHAALHELQGRVGQLLLHLLTCEESGQEAAEAWNT